MAEHKLTPEVILGTAVPIADLLTQLTMPYGNISEKLRDMGEKRGLIKRGCMTQARQSCCFPFVTV